MAKAVAVFEGGITERRQAAVREDGAVFTRWQERDPRYGYKWGKWRRTGQTLGHNELAMTDVLQNGFAELRRILPTDPYSTLINADGSCRVRLP